MSILFDRLARSTRLVLFETDYEDWKYASPGGTVFIVAVEGKPYGVTAKHVRQDFTWDRLCVTNRTEGKKIAGLKFINYPGELLKAAEGTDFDDIAIIEFSDDIDVEFFGEDYYPLDASTVVQAQTGDALRAYGALKEKLHIEDRTIRPTFAKLGYEDRGPHEYDPFIRSCSGRWKDLEFTSVTGISGAPVFNDTRGGLTGLMVRGGLKDGRANGSYIDFEDVVRVLKTVHAGKSRDDYVKVVRLTRRS